MKNTASFKLLNRDFYISISNKCHESFKKIVGLAPQEAQWFNTVTEIYGKNGELVCLELGDNLYVPEQICSPAEVNTSPTMMMDFYKELLKEHSPEETNQIISSMTCWSHSHVNMGVSPSGQDVLQFSQFVNQSQDQNCNKFQIMLIHNKKGDYYSRVFDPYTGLIYEGVPVHIDSEFDLSYISEFAKNKFKTKKLPVLKAKSSLTSSSLFSNLNSSFTYETQEEEKDLLALNTTLAQELLQSILKTDNLDLNSPLKFTLSKAKAALKIIKNEFDDQEYLWFYLLIANEQDKISKFFTLSSAEYFLNKEDNLAKIDSFFIEYLVNTKEAQQDLFKTIFNVYSFIDCVSPKQLQETVSRIF